MPPTTQSLTADSSVVLKSAQYVRIKNMIDVTME